MQISELVQRSDVPLATVKFYIREGMLPPGRATGPRQADYGEDHLRRLQLIRSLTTVAGLPLARTKQVLELIDQPDESLYETLGSAIDALGPDPTDSAVEGGFPRASAALDDLGPAYAESRRDMAAFAQLDAALAAADAAGLPVDPEWLRLYGEHIAAIAAAEVAALPIEDDDVVRTAVLRTVLVEPVLAALRRLAHQNAALHDL